MARVNIVITFMISFILFGLRGSSAEDPCPCVVESASTILEVKCTARALGWDHVGKCQREGCAAEDDDACEGLDPDTSDPLDKRNGRIIYCKEHKAKFIVSKSAGYHRKSNFCPVEKYCPCTCTTAGHCSENPTMPIEGSLVKTVRCGKYDSVDTNQPCPP